MKNTEEQNRRNFLAGCGIAPLLLAVPVQAGEPSSEFDRGYQAAMKKFVRLLEEKVAIVEPDPVLPLFEEWNAARADWVVFSKLPGNENFDFPESLEAEERESAAFDAMVETMPTSTKGIAALTHVTAVWEGIDLGDGLYPPNYTSDFTSAKLLSSIRAAARNLSI